MPTFSCSCCNCPAVRRYDGNENALLRASGGGKIIAGNEATEARLFAWELLFEFLNTLVLSGQRFYSAW